MRRRTAKRDAALADVEEASQRKRVVERSQSAVDADALPAHSKIVAGIRVPGAVMECGGKREVRRRFG